MTISYNRLIEELTNLPDSHVVLEDSTMSLSGRQLVEQRNAVAVQLLDLKIKEGDRVVVECNKTCRSAIVALACFRIGAIFVPVNPNLPGVRRDYILNKVEPKIVVREADPLARNEYCIHDLFNWVLNKDPSNQLIEVPEPDFDRPAYCIFTSGSTGFPKGVVISHLALSTLCETLPSCFALDVSTRFLSLGPLFFDVTVVDMLYPISQGSFVRLYDKKFVSQKHILDIVSDKKITHFCAVTALLSLISGHEHHFNNADISSLKQIMTGGDAVSKGLCKRWFAKNSSLSILNGYGPTEFTCTCIVYEVTSDNVDRYDEVPIGVAIPKTTAAMLHNDEIVSTEGELILAGPQRVTSYWGDEEAFKSSLYHYSDKVYYRTGDIVYKTEDGHLVFQGRKDEEVKLSGYRVHLGEVRRVIEQKLSLSDYYLLVYSEESIKHLCLVICQPQSAEVGVSYLASFLKEVLPPYMVPKKIVNIDAFPRQPGGKIDKKALMNLAELD